MAQQTPPPIDPSDNDEASPPPSSASEAAHPTPSQQPITSFAPWQISPGSVLLFSSLPLGLGTYIGYRRALHQSSPSPAASSSIPNSTKSNNINALLGGGTNSIWSQILHPESSSSSPKTIQSAASNATTTSLPHPPPILAARALALGTLLSISGTSLLLSSIFYLSDCHSVDELIRTWRNWAPQKLHAFETSVENCTGLSLGREERSMARREYERETRGMTEEEELEYVRRKVEGEIDWDADE